MQLRKHADCVKFAASRANHSLDPNFVLQIKDHLDTCQKENNEKKGEGKVDE